MDNSTTESKTRRMGVVLKKQWFFVSETCTVTHRKESSKKYFSDTVAKTGTTVGASGRPLNLATVLVRACGRHQDVSKRQNIWDLCVKFCGKKMHLEEPTPVLNQMYLGVNTHRLAEVDHHTAQAKVHQFRRNYHHRGDDRDTKKTNFSIDHRVEL